MTEEVKGIGEMTSVKLKHTTQIEQHISQNFLIVGVIPEEHTMNPARMKDDR